MRALRLLTTAALTLAATAASTEARADSMDPALGRLVLDDSCRTGRASDGQGNFYNPTSGFTRCLPNHAAFSKLVAQMGGAFAPIASHTARTTGFGGFRVGIASQFTTIDTDAPYWQQGTQGPPDTTTQLASVSNISPDSLLQQYSVQLAKGFPFGVELGAGFGFVANSNIVVGGGDVRMALFEGFREHVPGFLPDIGVGGAVRTITGTPEMKLTIAAFDAQISKPIPIAGTVTVHPHVGYQWIAIFGDSGLIDMTPNTDPVTLCGYRGDNNPASADPNKAAFDGQPVCTGSSADFNNNVVFNRARLVRHRINFGSQIRYQMINFGFHILTDLIPVAEANNLDDPDSEFNDYIDAVDPTDPTRQRTTRINRYADDPRTPEDDAVKSQWTFAFELGAVF